MLSLARNRGAAVMPNVLNPEPESITLNTETETPTLDPAMELDAPSSESTSNPETAEATIAAESPALDADASTEPVAQAAPAQPEAPAQPDIASQPETAAQPQAAAQSVHVAAPHEHGSDSAEDFSAALEAFEREQAAEAAAVEAYGDKVVSGTVIKQTEKHLVIDVGLKSEGLVPLEQVTDHTGAVKFQPGEVIDVVIEREEPEGGYLVSFEKAQRLRVWDTIEKHANDKTPIMGTVVSRVKGGLTVDIGMKAFLPGSQLEIRPVRNLDGYLGQQIEVRVIKLNKKRGNVVVSRKEILEEEQNAKRSTTLEHLGEDAVLTGTVKNLTDYGAFVDLGGIDGLLHITDMSWGRLTHPRDLVNVGDEIQV
jgi:small subunit ribosomal protein S1